jgi:PAS domain S-box-containing protein
VSRALRAALLLVLGLAALLMLLLAASSSSSSAFDRYYPWLVAANSVVALLMVVVTVAVIVRVYRRYKRRVFGTRLMVRLAIAFALIGAIPVALVSFISAQFLAKTIDTWFSQSVNLALESGVSLGRASLDTLSADVSSRARRLALAIEEVPPSEITSQIERAVDGREGADILVMSGSGRVLASRSAQFSSLVPELPSQEALNRARAARQYLSVEPRPGSVDRGLQVRAIAMTIRRTPFGDETRFVQWVEPIPDGLAKNLEALNDGVRDYQQLILGKEGLRKIYGVTLLLTLLLAFFGALLSAVLLSGWLAGPLRQLERATKAVASGDYRPLRVDPSSTDELNVLVGSFNEMTGQLNEARDMAQRSRQRLEESNQFLQQVLAGLSAGVMILDRDWRLLDYNPSAERLLGLDLSVWRGKPAAELAGIGGCVATLADGLSKTSDTQFQYEGARSDGQTMTLLVSGSTILGKQPQAVVVFDDIGELLSAQRARDFAEIARRLAHEIKNPLTPIQLSAERLERRLKDRLGPEEAELLHHSTKTIVEQVTSLKAMVDEFRNYARLPAANPEPLDLGQLLREMRVLYATDQRIQWPESRDAFWVMADRAQCIQVVHNLLQNAQDAVGDDVSGQITLCLDQHKTGAETRVRLMVLDNGPGLLPEMRGRLFEPYFTSKAKGSGLGLAIVKKIVEENHGRVSLVNRSELDPVQKTGAAAVVEFAKLDQATHNPPVGQQSQQSYG